MLYGPAAECSSKTRERLQVLLRIRPCPSAGRITAESQSQRRQAPLRIGSYSSSDESIRHDILTLFVSFVVFPRAWDGLASRERQLTNTRDSSQLKPLSANPARHGSFVSWVVVVLQTRIITWTAPAARRHSSA